MTFHQQSKQGPHECQTFSVCDSCGIFQRLFSRSESNFIDNYLASLKSNNRAGEISTIDRKRKIIAVKWSLGWAVGWWGKRRIKICQRYSFNQSSPIHFGYQQKSSTDRKFVGCCQSNCAFCVSCHEISSHEKLLLLHEIDFLFL